MVFYFLALFRGIALAAILFMIWMWATKGMTTLRFWLLLGAVAILVSSMFYEAFDQSGISILNR